MRRAFLALRLLAGCGATGSDPGQCLPACTGGQVCCGAPNPMFQPDGGGSDSTWVCVMPSAGACPLLP